MKVVKPVTVDDSVFQSSSIPEPDISRGEVEWSPNRNGAKYSISKNSTAIASSASVDYLISFSGVATMSEYTGGALTHSQQLTEIEFLPSDAHFYNGVVYIADLTKIKFYNASSKAEGEIIVSGGVEAGTVFTSITSVGSSFYLYDRVNKKIKLYSLNANVLTHQRDIEVNIGDNYPKLTTADSGGFFVLAVGVVSTYSDEFSLISEKKTPRLSYQSETYGGIVNNGTEVKAISTITESVESYSYDLEYKGLYVAGERVIKTSMHKVYQCSIGTDEDPEEGVKKVPPTWVEVGATNRWAMFDYKRTTKSIDGNSITLSFVFDVATSSVSVLDMVGVNSVRVVATSASSGEVFDQTLDTAGLIDLVVLDVPPFDDLTYNLTITGSGVEVGEVVFGLTQDVGRLVSGVVSDRIDYSRLVYDDFGEVDYVERPIVRYTTYPVVISKSNAPSIERYLDSLKGSQAVWIGDSGGGDLIITFGRIERSPMTYNNQSIVEYQIKVRGSI